MISSIRLQNPQFTARFKVHKPEALGTAVSGAVSGSMLLSLAQDQIVHNPQTAINYAVLAGASINDSGNDVKRALTAPTDGSDKVIDPT